MLDKATTITLREGRFDDIDWEKIAQDVRMIMQDSIIETVPKEQRYLSAERMRQDVIPVVRSMMLAIGYGDFDGVEGVNTLHACLERLTDFLDAIFTQSPQLRKAPNDAAHARSSSGRCSQRRGRLGGARTATRTSARRALPR